MGSVTDGVPGWDVLFADKPKKVTPQAFDPKRPNWKGYAHRPQLRVASKRSGQVVMVYEIGSAVQACASQEGARVSVRPTAGGYHVDWPEGDASTTRIFTLTARTGEWPKGYKDQAPDGMAEIAEIKKLLDYFLRDVDRGEYRLEFFNPDEPVDYKGAGDALWEVVPQQFSPQRIAGVQDWRFTLRMEAVKRLDLYGIGVQRGRITEARKKKDLWDRLRQAEQILADNSFDAWFFRYQLLLGPLTRLKAAEDRLLGFVQGWTRGAHEFIGYPAALIRGMIDDYDALVAEFESEGGAGNPTTFSRQVRADWRLLTGRRRDVKRLHNASVVNASTYAQGLGTAGDRQGSRSGVTGALQSPLQVANQSVLTSLQQRRQRSGVGGRRLGEMSTRLVYVAPGQTLASMVVEGFTTLDILQLNPDLEWPYVDGSRRRPAGYHPAEGQQRVAYQGDAVRVPTKAGAPPAAVNGEALAISRASEDERLFGRDLCVDDETRSLVLDPATHDLLTVSGVSNLLQRLHHALVMPLGSLRSAPDVGSYLLAEDNEWATDTGTRLDALAVRRTLQNDPGIAEVGGVLVDVEDGVRTVTFEATTISTTPLGRVTFAV